MTLPLASLAMLIGVVVVVAGLRREAPGLRLPVTDPRKALAMTRALRTTIWGAALVGVGAAWLWSIPALLALSLVVAAEETLEIGVVARALRTDLERRGVGPA